MTFQGHQNPRGSIDNVQFSITVTCNSNYLPVVHRFLDTAAHSLKTLTCV